MTWCQARPYESCNRLFWLTIRTPEAEQDPKKIASILARLSGELEHIEARLVVPRRITHQEEQQLKEIICGRLGYSFDLTFTYHDQIPRGPGGKFEDFVSEITQQPRSRHGEQVGAGNN